MKKHKKKGNINNNSSNNSNNDKLNIHKITDNISTENKYGYVRVSTKYQNIDRQMKSIIEYGVDEDNIYIDYKSGKSVSRTEYNKMKNIVKKGDTIVMTELDRLGRNSEFVKKEYNNFKEKGVKLVFTNEPYCNSDCMTNEQLEFKCKMSECELISIKNRQRTGINSMDVNKRGIKVSKKTGNTIGKPRIEEPANFAYCYEKYKNKEINNREFSEMTGLKLSTLNRMKKEYKNKNMDIDNKSKVG